MPSLSCVYPVSMDLSQQAARGQPGRSSRFWLVDHLRWKEWVLGKLLGSTGLWHTVHYGYLFSWQLPVLLFSFLCSFWSQNTLTSACLNFTGPQSWLLSVCPLQGLCFLSLKDIPPHTLSYLPVLDSSTACLMSVLLSLAETFQSSLWCLELHGEKSFG